MRTLGARKEHVQVGLDIGTHAIKAVEVATSGDTHRLTKFSTTNILSPLSEENIQSSLKTLLNELNPSAKDVNVSLSAPHAIVRFINMPRMKEEDLRNSLKYEAEKYIPFNINEVVIDVSILQDIAEDQNQMKVLLAAAKKTIIEQRLAVLKNCGFSASLIDIDSFACFNAFCNAQDKRSKTDNIVLLNIGHSQSNVVILKDDKPFFTRDIQIGGKDIVKNISRTLEIDDNKAEAILADPKDKSEIVTEAAKTALATLAEELRLSFGYYENQYGASISDIYLSGGLVGLKGLIEYLEESFDKKPLLWDPFEKFEKSEKIDNANLDLVKSQLAVATGLAIRK